MKSIPLPETFSLTTIIAVITLIIVFSAFISKALAREYFLNDLYKYLKRSLTRSSRIEKSLEKNAELMLAMSTDINMLKHEIIFNGGKYRLKDAVGDILKAQSIYTSERISTLYIDDSPIYKTDCFANVTFVNAAWLDMVGCTNANEMMGKGYYRAIPKNQLEDIIHEQENIKGGPLPYFGKFIFQHLVTKQLIETTVRSQVINDNVGPVGVIGTITNIKNI